MKGLCSVIRRHHLWAFRAIETGTEFVTVWCGIHDRYETHRSANVRPDRFGLAVAYAPLAREAPR